MSVGAEREAGLRPRAAHPPSVRILIRPRAPLLALLLLAPSIPELLTGSTPLSNLVLNPLGFAVNFGADLLLYGCGALLIREFVIVYQKGWATILLLGAAYGIAEEGITVHTFFQPGGGPVGAFATYGHAFGVNWLWALGLTVFHATYSIALPILLSRLWFPQVAGARWLDRGAIGLTAVGYFAVVGVGALFGPHRPSLALYALFLGMIALLVVLARWTPPSLLAPRPGRSTASRGGLWLAGATGFAAWTIVAVLAGSGRAPAIVAAALLVGLDLLALAYVLRYVGREDPVYPAYRFATGMLGMLFAWAVLITIISPILGFGVDAAAVFFAYLQYRLGQRLDATYRTRPAPALAR